MMDDEGGFLATEFGWWWLWPWVGLILDQEVGSGVDWAVQRRDLMRKLVDVRTWVHFPRRSQREPRGDVRKEEWCKQMSLEHIELNT